MKEKKFYKVVRAFKHNGEVHEFPFTQPRTFDEACMLAVDSTDFSVWSLLAVVPADSSVSRLADYIVTFEDRTDTLRCSYRVTAESGIKAIDAAISHFKGDYHHGDVDVIDLERCK